MTGNEIPAMTHGQNESILFARASSNAPALYGFAKREAADGLEGFPGTSVAAASPLVVTWRRDGDRRGEEKERR